jgi:uroporphyrin-III C-methyltransferase/precorrin-2 dehydrogenase/sirohydrochlorin ferrochelatase
MTELLPLFLNVAGRPVVLVGGGRVASAKLQQLLAAGAHVTVVAPEVCEAITTNANVDAVDPERVALRENGAAGLQPGRVRIVAREFEPADLDGAWLVVAAATAAVNRAVAAAAEQRRLFVNAVDDPANATAYLSGVVRRDGVTIAISTSGDAPALTSLLREGLDALLPRDLAAWIERARAQRVVWRRDAIPMEQRKPQLLTALNAIYRSTDEGAASVPWLHAPEDSWL